MIQRTMSDGRTMILLNEPSEEQAVQVVYRLVKARLDAEAKKKAEAEEKLFKIEGRQKSKGEASHETV